MSLNLLVNAQMIWMIFIKILKNTVEIKTVKYYSFVKDMIADMVNNKKRNPITKLFIRVRKLNIYLIFVIQSNFTV